MTVESPGTVLQVQRSSQLSDLRNSQPTPCDSQQEELCTWFGQGSPVCRSSHVLLALYTLQAREPCVHAQPNVCVKQHPAVPAGSISWGAPCRHTRVSFCFCQIWLQEQWLGLGYCGQMGWLKNHPLFMCRGDVNSGASQFRWSQIVPFVLREL